MPVTYYMEDLALSDASNHPAFEACAVLAMPLDQ